MKYGVLIAQLALALSGSDRDELLTQLVELLATREKSTLIVVSHDPALIGRFDSRIRLVGGRIASEPVEAAA